MKRKDRKYYVFIIAILALIVVFDTFKKKPVDWKFSLERKDKIPYGTYVLFNTINDIFPGKKIKINNRTTWEYSFGKNITNTNFLYISENFTADKTETEILLNLAENGNNLFIATHHFSLLFSDTLGIATGYSVFYDSISKLNFVNKKLKKPTPYFYRKSSFFMCFNDIDTVKDEILAYDKTKKPVFIRRKQGKGMIYLCSVPEVFTNYAMITERNYEFAYKALSYLPEKNLVWDEYYKPFRKIKKSSVSFLLENKSLKTAYYILLLTTLLFLFFTAKRRQRIIPVIKPYQNKTVEYVKTISNLYYKASNHKDIAEKLFIYLNNDLQQKFNVNLTGENPDFNKISRKTGIDKKTLKKLLSYYSKINNLEKISAQQLLFFNKLIEKVRKTI